MNLKSPLISVCIPVYNGRKYLEDCIYSVLNQTYKNLDILIIDDCSLDQSESLIEKFLLQDDRIRFISNDSTIGMVENWNKCIENSKGEWLKFLFQDDLMQPNCIEIMYNLCIETNVELAICSRTFQITEDCSTRLRNFFENDVIQLKNTFNVTCVLPEESIINFGKNNLFNNFIGEPNVFLIKRNLVFEIGLFNKYLRQLVDYEFLLRALLSFKAVFTPNDLVIFRVHGKSVSDSHTTIEKYIFVSFIEPMLLINEYINNKKFTKLKQEVGLFHLLESSNLVYERLKAANYLIDLDHTFKKLYPYFKFLWCQKKLADILFYYKRLLNA